MDANADVGRIYVFLEDGGDELVIEVGDGKAVHRETFADGIVLERSETKAPLRIRLQGLKAKRWTNATISPAIRCEGDVPLVEGGARVYLLGIRQQGAWAQMYAE